MFPLLLPYVDVIDDGDKLQPIHYICNLHENNLITVEVSLQTTNYSLREIEHVSSHYYACILFGNTKKGIIEVGIVPALEIDEDIGYVPLFGRADYGSVYACFAPRYWDQDIKQQIYDSDEFDIN
jgi:hypothetical protein